MQSPHEISDEALEELDTGLNSIPYEGLVGECYLCGVDLTAKNRSGDNKCKDCDTNLHYNNGGW